MLESNASFCDFIFLCLATYSPQAETTDFITSFEQRISFSFSSNISFILNDESARSQHQPLFLYLHAPYHDVHLMSVVKFCVILVFQFVPPITIAFVAVLHAPSTSARSLLSMLLLPFFCIASVLGNQLHVVDSSCGESLSADAFLARLIADVESHHLVQQQQSEISSAHVLREQQDREYQQALEEDRQRERQQAEQQRIFGGTAARSQA